MNREFKRKSKEAIKIAQQFMEDLRREFPEEKPVWGICLKEAWVVIKEKNNTTTAVSINVIQEELISNEMFKELIHQMLYDDFYGLQTILDEGREITSYEVKGFLRLLNCAGCYDDIFWDDDSHYSAKAYNELLIKIDDMGTKTGKIIFNKVAKYGFEFMVEEIESFKNHDSNNPPF